MRKKILLSTAASAVVFTGIGLTVTSTDKTEAAPFIEPDVIARSICGETPDAIAKRRAVFVSAASAWAQEAAMPSGSEVSLPIHPSYRYAITTAVPEAQGWFDQGLAQMFNFNHAEAVLAFRKAQEIDPECAMCFWAEGYALGPNINSPMAAEDVAPAFAAAQKALALSDPAQAEEHALITALQARYAEEAPEDRSALEIAFAEAMGDAASQHPDNDFIAVIAAEANMDTQAWDYWLAGGRLPNGRTAQTLSLLETILNRSPDFGPAIHLYIHLTEASTNPWRAQAYADRLAGISDGLGHLIHMPSHTYYRIGKYRESLAHNIDAVAADEAYIETADASILYEYGYFTHNVHFAMTSAMMGGDAATALSMAEKLDSKLPFDMIEAAEWIEPIKAAPYYAMAQFAPASDILALQAPPEDLRLLNAAYHYAQATALIQEGDLTAARARADRIAAILGDTGLTSDNPIGAVMQIARLTIIAKAAAAEQDFITALEAMEAAVALQDALPYTEPPYWYYPSRQTLAAIALQAGQTDRAEQLFIETLAVSPNNAYALAGLVEVYKVRKDKQAQRYAKDLLEKAWLGRPKDIPPLAQL